jgi:hypothetical protein
VSITSFGNAIKSFFELPSHASDLGSAMADLDMAHYIYLDIFVQAKPRPPKAASPTFRPATDALRALQSAMPAWRPLGRSTAGAETRATREKPGG